MPMIIEPISTNTIKLTLGNGMMFVFRDNDEFLQVTLPAKQGHFQDRIVVLDDSEPRKFAGQHYSIALKVIGGT